MRSATATYKRLAAATASANGSAASACSSAKKPTTPPMTAVRLVSRFSDQRAPARHARIQQHREVADFLGDFVRHDGQRRDDAEVHVGEEGRGDQHAVEHVVQGVAHQHQRAARLLAGLLVLMSVVVAVVMPCASPTGCSAQ